MLTIKEPQENILFVFGEKKTLQRHTKMLLKIDQFAWITAFATNHSFKMIHTFLPRKKNLYYTEPTSTLADTV